MQFLQPCAFYLTSYKHYDHKYLKLVTSASFPYWISSDQPILAFRPYNYCSISDQPQPSSYLRYLYQLHCHVSPPSQACHTHSPSQIHLLHHLRRGLNLELYITLRRGWCFILFWHDYTWKNWLVVCIYIYIKIHYVTPVSLMFHSKLGFSLQYIHYAFNLTTCFLLVFPKLKIQLIKVRGLCNTIKLWI